MQIAQAFVREETGSSFGRDHSEVSRKPGDHLIISRGGGVHRLSGYEGKRKFDLFIDCTEIRFLTSETTISQETVLTAGVYSSITARV